MEDNREMVKDIRDSPGDIPPDKEPIEEDSPPSPQQEKQNSDYYDSMKLKSESPNDKDERNPVENLEKVMEGPQSDDNQELNIGIDAKLLTDDLGDDKKGDPCEDVELESENPHDEKELHASAVDKFQSEDFGEKKEEKITEEIEFQSEGPDLMKEKNLCQDLERQSGDPVAPLEHKDRSDNVDGQGLVENTIITETVVDANMESYAKQVNGNSRTNGNNVDHLNQLKAGMPSKGASVNKAEDENMGDEVRDTVSEFQKCSDREIKEEASVHVSDGTKAKKSEADLTENKKSEPKLKLDVMKEEELTPKLDAGHVADMKNSNRSFLLEGEGDESGTEEEQAAFMKELEMFFKERSMEFKPPKFYGEGLNLLKLWRAVTRLGGYDQVTSCKLWRQVGESFKPPKTCTTVSWTFRCFYEKALLEYEKHKIHGGELPLPDSSLTEPSSTGNQAGGSQGSGSGRARRDAAARAMQGWHSQRLLGNGEVGDPIIKDKNASSMLKREKQLKSIGLLKRKTPSPVERAVKVARMKATKPQVDTMVVDVGPPADWVKINVRRTKDCFEVYALVPGLLREEVRVQSDPVGRLVISGEPEQLDNPWGVTPFKKVVSLPSRIDPHQTSAVVTLHGQLFVRVPFEQSDL